MLHRELGPRRARAARAARTSASARSTRARCPTSSPRRSTSARTATGASPPTPADLQDRRVEITGPGRSQDGDQRAQLGREGLHGRLRGRELADLDELRRGPAQPDRRRRADDLARHRSEKQLQPERRDRDAARPPARLAPAREARARRRRARLGGPVRLRPLHVPLRGASCSTRGTGPYFYLPKLESHLEARLWNDVFVLAAGRARHRRAAPSARPS